MDKVKQLIKKLSRDSKSGGFSVQPSKAKSPVSAHIKEVDTGKFAKAVVQEYGETLVLLGKE